MVQRHGFSDEEWETLLYVPFVVFQVVALADGKLNYPESNMFANSAKSVGANANRPQDALVRDVLREVGAEFGPIAQRLGARLATGLTFEAIMESGRELLDTRVETTQAKVFKATMIQLAEAIAGIYPLFGRKVTADEQNAIEKIKHSLGIAGPGDAFVPFSS